MNDTTVQAAPEWGAFRRWYILIAALLAALLLLLWLLGYGPGGSACKLPAAPVAVAPAAVTAPPVVAAAPAVMPAAAPAVVATPPPPAPVATPAPVTAAVAAAVTAPPAARVYFGLDRTALPGDVENTLGRVVGYLKANSGAKASIAGFHDPSGAQAHNEELALNRARAVRGQMEKMGIANDRLVMQMPAATTGTGPPREARRVEVAVQAP